MNSMNKPLSEKNNLQLQQNASEAQSRCETTGNDPFTVVEEDQMSYVINIVKSRLPRSAHVYNMAKMASKFSSVTVFTLRGDLSENAIFLLIDSRQDYNQDISISPPLDFKISETVKQDFINTSKIDWNSKFMFSAVDRLISPMILDISTMYNRNSTLTIPDYYYYMSQEDAANLDLQIPPGVEVKALSLDLHEGIDLILNGWKYARPGTEGLIRDIVDKGIAAAAYVDGVPVCGMIVHRSGLLGMLFTAKGHRNKGYAKIVTQFLMKQLGTKGFVIASAVECKNTASREFHQKVGMIETHICDDLIFENAGFDAK